MLVTSPYRDVTVIDVARMAGTSPATFYQYFSDIETAIIELAGDMVRDAAQLKELASAGTWSGKTGYANAEALVEGFLAFWPEHDAILRVVELAAAEGDKRFSRIRGRVLGPVASALAGAISSAKGDGSPAATATALVTMLSAVAAARSGFEGVSVKPKDMRTSLAVLVCQGITGRKPTR
jgi:AcrR family transcriptional regulator